MTERIGREKINRKPGYLYFIGKDGDDALTILRLNNKNEKANAKIYNIFKLFI